MASNAFFALRALAIPVLAAAIAFFEIQRPLGPFRLFTMVCVSLLLADATSLLRGRLRDVLLVITSFVSGLSGIEASVSWSAPENLLVNTPGLSVPQPVIGWGPRHSGRFHARKIDPRTGTVVYDVEYTIDQNLLRQTNSCETCSTIAFFGDSLTFGEGVNDSDSLPQLLADSLSRKERVLNLGFSGYGPQQFLRELETNRFDKVIGAEPKLFVFLTGGWMVERSACKAPWVLNAPRYELEKGRVMYVGPCEAGPTLRMRQWVEHTALYRVFIEPHIRQLTQGDVDLDVRILLAAAALAKAKYGVQTIFPYIGSDLTTEEIVNGLRAGGADVIDVSLSEEEAAGERLRIPGDGHPTPLANRLRAAILKNYIEAKIADHG